MSQSDSSNQPRYSAIWYFLSRYKVLFFATLVLMLVSSALESVSILAFFPLFSTILSDNQSDSSGVLGGVIRLVDLIPIVSPLLAASVLLISVLLTRVLFNLGRDSLIAYANGKLLYDVKQQVIGRYSSSEYLYILDKKQGELLYSTIEAPSGVSGAFAAVTGMIMSLLKVAAIMVVLLAVLPWAALAVILMGFTYYVLIHHVSKRVSYRIGEEKASANAEQLVIGSEFLTGCRQILAFNGVTPWVQRFDIQNRIHSKAVFKELLWGAIPRPFVEIAVVCLMLGLVLVLASSGSDGLTNALPTAGLFAVAMVQLMAPISSFGQMRMSVMTMLHNLEIVHEAVTNDTPTRRSGTRELDKLKEGIKFKSLSFRYPGRDPIFENLDLMFERGKVTAVVGASGSGKTTLANLVLGLLHPTSGGILIDDIPIEELDQKMWVSKIGFVSQDPFTYHTSIKDNILIGRCYVEMDKIISAAQIANAHDFIKQTPQGYETIVGDRGMRLSGGQQQRLAIARAVLDEPEVLIFDEATSSLDTMSERSVQEAIDAVSNDRTVIIIAHRLSTIERSDKIIVLDNGQVVEEGSHQELLKKNGQYAQLVAS